MKYVSSVDEKCYTEVDGITILPNSSTNIMNVL